MKKLITIAVDAMGGDNSPQKIIDGIEHHHQNSKNIVNLSEKVSVLSVFLYNDLFLVNFIKLL